MSFENSLKRLNEILEQLESSSLSLEDSIKLYQEGIELSVSCKKELEAAKLKVTVHEQREPVAE
ncbi:MAG: exodeoxyribonuclease VII small subunit [Oscillospiraceae bacterium]|jgi:exodeoxyribonuclease VII small subunit